LAIGAIYALVALGYTLVYGVLRLINFAHSEIFALGIFASTFAIDGMGLTGTRTGVSLLLTLAVLLVASMAVSGTAALVMERVAYRPLRRRNAPRLTALITAIGISLVVQEFLALRYGRARLNPQRVFEKESLFGLFGEEVRNDKVLVFVAAIILMVGLDQFVRRSRLGRGIRATAQDAETAQLMGVNIDRVVMLTFLLGGLLAGRRRVPPPHLLRGRPVQHRLPARHQGLHRRRARRHRQHPGRAGRGPAARPDREVRCRHLRRGVDRRVRLRRARPRPSVPAERPARRDPREGTGMSRLDLKRFSVVDRVGRAWDRMPLWGKLLVLLAILAFVIWYPSTLSRYWQSVLFFPVGVYILLALGLNIVVGQTGMLDLGYVAFFAVGAYTTAKLTADNGSLTAWEVVVLAIVLAMVAGVTLGGPTLRLRGDYLAIVTLGFGEIVRIIAQNSGSLGEARGITGIPHPSPLPGLDFGTEPLPYFYLVLACVVLAILLVARLKRSRVGRAWAAIREDEDAAELMGCPPSS
jgi:ABC-type branched-subunit amino acid transport system permease subunit